ncbi:hypothetical protein ACVWZM_001568 [Bradyrhizobium sp. USDA 4501]
MPVLEYVNRYEEPSLRTGGQGRNPNGTQSVIESMMNRAIVRGTNLETQARWYRMERGGHYDPGNKGRGALENPAHRTILERSLVNALAGANLSNYATDNASAGLAQRERASGKFRFRSEYGGRGGTGSPGMETFFAPGTAEPGLAVRWDHWHQSTIAAEAAAAARGDSSNVPTGDAPTSRPRVVIPTGNGLARARPATSARSTTGARLASASAAR